MEYLDVDDNVQQNTVRYPGDINPEECRTPRSFQTAVSKLKTALKEEKRKVHRLQQTLYRRKKTEITITSILNNLKEKMLISENARKHIKKVKYTHSIRKEKMCLLFL